MSTPKDLVLVSHHLCPYVQRAVIVLTEKKIRHEQRYIDLANKPDWFLAASPLGKTPILMSEVGIVFESQVIAEYLDETTPGSIHPKNALERARSRSWIEFGSETLNAIAALYNAPDAAAFEEKRTALRAKIDRVERELRGPWFHGKTFHLIDGVWGTVFRYFDVFDQIADFELTSKSAKIEDWRRRIAKRPSVRDATPEGYPERLMTFLRNRNAHIATLTPPA